MKEVYPDYADRVHLYAVGTDPTESLQEMESYRVGQGYPWHVAEGEGNMLRDLRVLQQSTKIAFNSQGVIVYRDGYGQGDVDDWRSVFDMLAPTQ